MIIVPVTLTNGLVQDVNLGVSSNLVSVIRLINESNLYCYVRIGDQEDYLAPWDDAPYEESVGKIHVETSSIASGGAAPSPYSTLSVLVYQKGDKIPAHIRQSGRRQLVRQTSPNTLTLALAQANGTGTAGILAVNFPNKKGFTSYIQSFLVVVEQPPTTPNTLSIGPTSGVSNANAVLYYFQEGASFQPSTFFQYPSPMPATGKNTPITMSLTVGNAADYYVYVWGFYQ